MDTAIDRNGVTIYSVHQYALQKQQLLAAYLGNEIADFFFNCFDFDVHFHLFGSRRLSANKKAMRHKLPNHKCNSSSMTVNITNIIHSKTGKEW